MDSDLVLFPEERIVGHGYQEGFLHGCNEGFSEGFENGQEVGLKTIDEVGYYYGFTKSLLQHQLISSSDSKAHNVVASLDKLLSSVQLLSPNSGADLNKIRSKYKQLMSLLKVQSNSKFNVHEKTELTY